MSTSLLKAPNAFLRLTFSPPSSTLSSCATIAIEYGTADVMKSSSPIVVHMPTTKDMFATKIDLKKTCTNKAAVRMIVGVSQAEMVGSIEGKRLVRIHWTLIRLIRLWERCRLVCLNG